MESQDKKELDINQLNQDKPRNIQWYPGHMAKAKREMEKDLALVDIVMQVLDARAPRSSFNPQLKKLAGNKPQILIMNKADLADPEATVKWHNIYRDRGYFVCQMNAAQKKGVKELFALVEKATQPLMERLVARGRLKRPVRAMIIGIPNSGKSTVINAITPQAVAKTGNKPGVTKGRQWVKTTLGIELLDTPGVLWPKFDNYDTAFNLALIGSISDQVLPINEIAERLALRLKEYAPASLIERYRLEELPECASAIIEMIGKKRGLLGAGGVVRYSDAAMLLINEFRSGKLGRYTIDDLK